MTATAPLADTEILFGAHPDRARAARLRRSINGVLANDLRVYVNSAAKRLPNSAAAAAAALEGLDVTRKLNPLLFTLHWQLNEGLRTQRPGAVSAALGRLARVATDGELYGDGFRVETMDWDVIDAEAASFFTGADGPRSERGGLVEIAPVTPAELGTGKVWVSQALDALRELDPELHEEFYELVSRLRLVHGSVIRGATSSRCWGLNYLRVPDPGAESAEPVNYFLDHLVHESGHLMLHALMSADPLLKNPFEARHSAPIRRDARPLYGVFHATFVLSRISRVLARHTAADPRPVTRALRDESVQRFRKGYETIIEHADLTDAGRMVLASCRELVEAEL
ncbi:aKG-HExxH-type peptide beta-hydroxylase [Streptomyces sp. NRRL F-2747]|uniref:aKG-HExxH-type peptide beta-hydroxylase n=1 Tax=Streptomyces sp. NRRL F-2747 TaxID=1463843 RepID=UPI0004C7D6F8|nr:HEXXH motif-containing putative peptide modification protein [Streptomyces sp. NRRL F-2747]